MSNYSDFNFWVFNYYKDHNICNEIGCLAVDEYDYKCSGFKGISFEEINEHSWVNLKREDAKHKIPLYFGLIGLQCLAATIVDDNRIRETFKDLAGFDNLLLADNNFKETFNNKNIQDEIWIDAKYYLKVNHSILIEIPPLKEFKDRYIQYPKSQVLLNKNDLTEYIPVFEKLHERHEVLSIKVLIKEIKNSYLKFSTKNNKNDSLDFHQKQVKYQQVFNYYNSDEWQTDVYRKKVYQKSINNLKRCYLTFENNNIQLFNSEDLKITPSEILKVYGDFSFFKKHMDYDEFERTDYLEYNEDYIILYKKSFSNGKTISGNVILQDDNFGFNRIIFNENEPVEPYAFNQCFRLAKEKISLEGIRIGRRDIFLKNLGPKIICADSYSIYHENLHIEYDKNVCLAGNYRIKRAGYSDVRFEIVQYCISDIENKDLESSHGWRVDNFCFDKKGTRLIGAKFIEDKSISKQELTLNKWINSNTMIDSKAINKFATLIRHFKNGY